jgi:hypothetical protein
VLGRQLLAVHTIAVHFDRQGFVPHEAHSSELPVEKGDLSGRGIKADLRGAEHLPLIEQIMNIAKLPA